MSSRFQALRQDEPTGLCEKPPVIKMRHSIAGWLTIQLRLSLSPSASMVEAGVLQLRAAGAEG